MKKGVRWRVGNGEKIKVWEDNWVPKAQNLKVCSPDLYNLRPITVSNLLNADGMSWNSSLIDILFWDVDADEILKIPLSSRNIEDVRVWHYTKHGIYSV